MSEVKKLRARVKELEEGLRLIPKYLEKSGIAGGAVHDICKRLLKEKP